MLYNVLARLSWRELPPFVDADATPPSLMALAGPLLDRSSMLAIITSLPSSLGLVLVLGMAALTIHRIWAIPTLRGFVPVTCFALLCLPLPSLVAVIVITGWMLAVWLPYEAAPGVAPEPVEVLWQAPVQHER